LGSTVAPQNRRRRTQESNARANARKRAESGACAAVQIAGHDRCGGWPRMVVETTTHGGAARSVARIQERVFSCTPSVDVDTVRSHAITRALSATTNPVHFGNFFIRTPTIR
jgi:hypothetical protein